MFPITVLFGGLIIGLIIILAMNTTRTRMKTPRDPSAEQKEALRRAIRTHANNFEHGIPVILMMMFYEINVGDSTVLCGIGMTYLLSRVIYSLGYYTKPGAMLQQVGAGVTYLVELTLLVLLGMSYL